MVISLITNNGDEIKLGYDGVYMITEIFNGQILSIMQVMYVDGTSVNYTSWESHKINNT